ncbi:hypothetical protein LOCC1_G003267 [Lachnellula occidentalis]|uniref:Aminoglycoside phosphotransferase domain-containing protein n=1 Tax=Lachnellula occidentalis TaxID=215460 RepID=A0A8H8RYS9_9HELO|nr:hypothetical protein LOCC1_G003267 [Lachnellula occidentalis]
MSPTSSAHDTNIENDGLKAEATSTNAELNQIILKHIQAAITADPDIFLYKEMQRILKEADDEQIRSRAALRVKNPKFANYPTEKPNYCARLVARTHNAEIMYALSDETKQVLSSYLEPDSGSELIGASLVTSLSRMILSCEKLWEGPTRGVVLKCNPRLVAKIIQGNDDYTEYTSIQYLQEHAPDIPAPRPHGLVKFGSARIMFMTYFPSTTLESAWPNLTHENKLLIQDQLNDIFLKLRALTSTSVEHRLGGVNGEGVKDLRRDGHESREPISTVAAFEEFQFSIPPHNTSSYIAFLRSLLPPASSTVVFTHGDVRTANIMVDVDQTERYHVTGIIDWEISGFYPEYFESSKILYIFRMYKEEDWWKYLPPCIAPAKNAERWLIDRMWDTICYA